MDINNKTKAPVAILALIAFGLLPSFIGYLNGLFQSTLISSVVSSTLGLLLFVLYFTIDKFFRNRTTASLAQRKNDSEHEEKLNQEQNTFSLDKSYNYLHFNWSHQSEMEFYFNKTPRVGQSILELVPVDISKVFTEQFQQALEGKHFSITKKLRKNFFKMVYTPIYNTKGVTIGLTCILSDITEKVRGEQQLEKYHENLESEVEKRTKELLAQRDFFQKIIDANSNLIFVRDQIGIYTLVNKAAADSFPKELGSVVGKTVQETHYDIRQADVFTKEDLEILGTGRKFTSESIFEDQDGIKKSLYLTKSLLEVNNEKYILGVHTDITALKQQEAALKKSNIELSNALEKLQNAQTKLVESEKLASLGQLTAGLAHEINNPLNYVSGNVLPLKEDLKDVETIFLEVRKLKSELSGSSKGQAVLQLMEELEIDVVIEEIRDLLDGIENGTGRVKELMGSLKNLTRYKDNDPEPIDINKMMRSIISLIKPSLKDKIVLEQKLAEISRTTGNGSELSQVVLNMIDNALFAMGKEGTLTLETFDNESSVNIRVSDTGSGIKKDHLKNIFDPFFTTKEVGEGTGLGLAISHQIVNKHEGQISAESEKGKGTTFLISLPKRNE